MVKKIILVWKQKFLNHPSSFWGLGDMIRGTLAVYQYCKKNNIEFIVDNISHPVTQFLKYKVDTNVDKTNIEFVPYNLFDNYIEQNKNKDTLIFMTNAFTSNNIDDDCKNFIKNILEPSDDLKEGINNYLKNLPDNFSIMHFRLFDSDFNTEQVNEIYNPIYKLAQKYYDEKDLFISSSSPFKNFVKQNNNNINVSELISSHVGYETDPKKIYETLLEFFVCTKASKIKTFNQYGPNVSGFVCWINNIYDVPITIIKKNIRFISFGCDRFIESKKRIYVQAKISKFFDKITIYSPQNLGKDFWEKHQNFINNNKRGYGYWLWKSYITLKELSTMDDDDILVYADTGCSVNNLAKQAFERYIEILDSQDVDIICYKLLGDYHLEYKWTKNDVFEYFNLEEEHKNSSQIMAGIFYCKKTKDMVNFFETLYKNCSENYNLIDDSPSISLNHKDFYENRHDQSMFSCSLKKYFPKKCLLDDTTGSLNDLWCVMNTPILGTRLRS